MSQRQYNYKYSLLRNFTAKQLQNFLEKEIVNFKELLKRELGSSSLVRIGNILNNLIARGFNDKNIESTLFHNIVYLLSDRVYHMNLVTDSDCSSTVKLLSNSDFSNYVDRKISQVVNTNEDLITIRQEGERLIFLFRLDTVELGYGKEKSNFYVSCILDFADNYAQIRLRNHYLRASHLNLTKVLQFVEGFVKTLPGAIFLERFNEAALHTALYKMFIHESEKSLNLIKKKVREEEEDEGEDEEALRINISDYLKKQLNITDPIPYVDKVMSVKYQDTARSITEKEFIKDGGFIFAFSFIDRKITRSTNRNEDHKPVYYSKIYWNLKDVVKDYKELSELGVYWKFNKSDFGKPLSTADKPEDVTFVEVGFREIHNVLEIHYYVNTLVEDLAPLIKDRRVKENYVIWKIKSFIRKK